MSDYVTEAEALADIYDGCEAYEDFEPYSQVEKREYVRARENAFSKDAVGKFVVVQKPRRHKDTIKHLYLVDRAKTKRMWWSPYAGFALLFEKQSAAEFQAKQYKYNKARVLQVTQQMAQLHEYVEEYC